MFPSSGWLNSALGGAGTRTIPGKISNSNAVKFQFWEKLKLLKEMDSLGKDSNLQPSG
jgi:hypothetical protein